MADMRVIVGKNVLGLRKAKGWTQEQLAEMSSSTYVNVSAIENGRRWPSPSMVKKLADALGVPQPRLFFDPGVLTDEEIVAAVQQRFGFEPAVPPRKARRG